MTYKVVKDFIDLKDSGFLSSAGFYYKRNTFAGTEHCEKSPGNPAD